MLYRYDVQKTKLLPLVTNNNLNKVGFPGAITLQGKSLMYSLVHNNVISHD